MDVARDHLVASCEFEAIIDKMMDYRHADRACKGVVWNFRSWISIEVWDDHGKLACFETL